MKAKPKKKPRRVVLGVGHPWFTGMGQGVTLLDNENPYDAKALRLQYADLGAYNRIRLVAEVLK